MQIYKYVVHMVAQAYGKTATFMPKPIAKDNGIGHAHPHLDLERRQAAVRRQWLCRPVRHGLYFIGGVIKHAKALNAFTNPTTNSYKRLVPGYEAPVLLAYSAATARPPAASLTAPARRRSGSSSASPMRWPIPISLMRRC